MQKRVTITKLLSYIEEASAHILSTCTEITNNGELASIVDDVGNVFPNVARSVIQQEATACLSDYCETPTTVKKELDAFVAALDEGASTVENDDSGNYTFLREVWLGDTYGVGGIEGLKALAKELKETVDSEIADEVAKKLGSKFALKK